MKAVAVVIPTQKEASVSEIVNLRPCEVCGEEPAEPNDHLCDDCRGIGEVVDDYRREQRAAAVKVVTETLREQGAAFPHASARLVMAALAKAGFRLSTGWPISEVRPVDEGRP